ncbi:PLP-dependent transferase [Auriscalpium vulgare]|uniref:PLP-dependent transferase n=1 Tax=Auriscalpium vulgare TaxID=40419 RepID=A0ACB8RQF1_9AGAM|nr:PLP-dependent transferase [Auriscalpium vulgare]
MASSSSSSSSPLHAALEHALTTRAKRGVPTTDVSVPIPNWAPDLFSNDYLSIATNLELRETYLSRLVNAPHLFGSRGSRLLAGNTPAHLALENRLRAHFDAPAALLFNSGFEANSAFFGSVPQDGDAILFDELVHASCRHGMASSRARQGMVPFSHNSLKSFEDRLRQVLRYFPAIKARKATLFVAVESLYSMDGDFAPLPEMLRILQAHVPEGAYHVVVDEAHSTGIYGRGGRGFVAELGLEDRVQTVVHTFGKGRGLTGAVITTSPTIRRYLINYGRPVIFSTSMPHINIIALHTSFDIIEGHKGDLLRTRLHNNSALFRTLVLKALENIPTPVLSLPDSHKAAGSLLPYTPIFPILTCYPLALAAMLQAHGYAAQPIPYPAVPKGQERIRVVIHADNTEEELRAFVTLIYQWALAQKAPALREKDAAVATASRGPLPLLMGIFGGQSMASPWLSWFKSLTGKYMSAMPGMRGF